MIEHKEASMNGVNYVKKINAVFLVSCFMLAACSGGYSNVMTRYKAAGICCQSPRDFSYEELKLGDSKMLELDDNSPAFHFITGKSYFKAFSLPSYAGPYKISVQSYMHGNYIETAHIFVPRLIFLNEKYEVVRATDPHDFRLEQTTLSETWGLRFKLVGSADVSDKNSNEKFFIVMTTAELLQEKTSITVPRTVPIPLAGSMLPIPTGEKGVLVPNSPVGRIKIALTAGSSPKGETKSFTVPAVTQGRNVGNLTLGQTTLRQALKILPAFPGYPPEPPSRELDPEHVGKVREALRKAKLGYNPMWSPSILIFDNNEKLIIVQTNFDDLEEGKKVYEKYKYQLKEVSKQRLQGDIEPCITLEIFLRETGEINGAGYIYTCPTAQ